MIAFAKIAVGTLTAINVAGMVGVAWFAAHMLAFDGVMVVELSICAGLLAFMATITAGGLLLKRRGKPVAAIVLLAVAALPTLFVFGFLLYLDSHPIDWR